MCVKGALRIEAFRINPAVPFAWFKCVSNVSPLRLGWRARSDDMNDVSSEWKLVQILADIDGVNISWRSLKMDQV